MPFRTVLLRSLVGVILSMMFISCDQLEYVSPTPGIVEVRLRVKNSRTDLMPFAGGDTNYVPLLLRTMHVTQPGNVKLVLLSDLHAIRRNPDGDLYNGLSTLARDSAIILGQAYAPPGTFTGLEFTLEWVGVVFLGSGFFPAQIPIQATIPPAPAYNNLEPLSIGVRENQFTRVTLTLDLDSSLVQRTEWFELHPRYYVSSVQNF